MTPAALIEQELAAAEAARQNASLPLPIRQAAERPRGSPAGAEQPQVVQPLSGAAAGSGRASRPEPRATAAGPFGRREASPDRKSVV